MAIPTAMPTLSKIREKRMMARVLLVDVIVSEHVVAEGYGVGASQLLEPLRSIRRQRLRVFVPAVRQVYQRGADAEAAKPLSEDDIQGAAPLLDDVRRLVGTNVRDPIPDV